MVTCLCQKCCSMLMQLSIRSEDGGVGMPLRGVKRSDCRGRTGRSKFYTVIGLHCFNGLNYSAPAAMPAAMLCIRLSECRNLRGRGGHRVGMFLSELSAHHSIGGGWQYNHTTFIISPYVSEWQVLDSDHSSGSRIDSKRRGIWMLYNTKSGKGMCGRIDSGWRYTFLECYGWCVFDRLLARMESRTSHVDIVTHWN